MGSIYSGKNMRVDIVPDEFAQDPRVDCDNLATFVCSHRRYKLGDKLNGLTITEHFKIATLRSSVYLPLFLYDHSGITISTRPFTCPWDSGQVGFAYIPKEKWLEEFRYGYGEKDSRPWQKISAKRREFMKKMIRDEVETYDQYLTGDVWKIQVIELDADGEYERLVDEFDGYYGLKWAEEHAAEIIAEGTIQKYLDSQYADHNDGEEWDR